MSWLKFTVRNLKKGVQKLYRKKFIIAPTNNAANNVMIVLKIYYVNTIKQELSTAKSYEDTLVD